MKKIVFIFSLFVSLTIQAQVIQPARVEVICNPYTGNLDTIHLPEVKMVTIRGQEYKQVDDMIVIGDDEDHTVFIDPEMWELLDIWIKEREEREAKEPKK